MTSINSASDLKNCLRDWDSSCLLPRRDACNIERLNEGFIAFMLRGGQVRTADSLGHPISSDSKLMEQLVDEVAIYLHN